MWRVRGGLASLKPRVRRGPAAVSLSASAAPRWQWRSQQQNAGLWQQLANFSSEPSGRSQSQEEAKNPALRSSQGDEAMKITRVGMYVNVAMAASKGAVGLAIHSSALVADAAHSLSDLLSDVVTLWSVKVARLPPDPKHPYGYGKYEAVGSLSVGAILVLCGIGIGADGLQVMQEIWNGAAATQLPEFDIPLLSELDRGTQWALAAGAAGVSIAAKEALYHATVKIGKQANSKVLIANAWHHRTDAISSVVALGGIVGSMFGVPLLDPVAGMAVAAMIVKTGGEICLDSVQELTDNTVEAEVLETLKEVSGSVDDVLNVSQVRARRMGPYTLVDLRVHLDARTSISMAQQIAERVRSHTLQEVPDVSEVLVHIDVQFEQFGFAAPAGSEACEKEFRPYREIKNDISYALATIPEITGTTHINTHWLPHLNGQGTVVDVAIVVQPDLKVGAANAVAKKARKAIEAIPYIVEADIHLELQDDDSDQITAG
ncbi:hypothetical protein PF005_g13539 [Phytophthora fragariae]|uniref:Uncharacterized protein n=2 Tax=Phytophthora TaxID=4783 RepID=A0A6A3S4M0_9STRA|nr:hypothetical protein PF003_g3840 [Phytophthora fragariae]KAE9006733.1 hypothetical protein PR001_g17135 [Phytophthora rubi]KAE8935290.1 hypothetical protein PF009_g14749 [Phytophthora fragariae]KAE9007775.1 hypothetical protein PF011_g10986 [Phytophthora fragariae]KAE9038862.1 hypothetical protein PR002_g5793 [Phytophthora rubi]